MQQAIVIAAVCGCAWWLGYYVYRFFAPRKGRACGGTCCDGGKKQEPAKPAAAGGGGQTVFIAREDLVARVKARKG